MDPQGIRELELTLGCGEQWPEATFLLGMLHPTLRRLLVAAPDPAAELPAGGAAYLSCLRGLTSLDLDNCLASLGPGIGQLTCLQELLVSHDELSYDFEVPEELGALTQLTRLELVRCVSLVAGLRGCRGRLCVAGLRGCVGRLWVQQAQSVERMHVSFVCALMVCFFY